MFKLVQLLLLAGVTMGAIIVHASSAIAIPKNANGKVGHIVSIQSKYEYKIDNNTENYQDYICYEKLEVNGKKEKRDFKFSVSPHSSKSSSTDMISFGYAPTHVGTFIIRSSIKIEGAHGVANNASADLVVS